MLTKLEKKILDYLISQDASIIDVTNGFPGANPKELYSVCTYLKNKGYLEDIWADMSLQTSASLSYKGKHYREISGLEFKEFLMKSILTPIGVALAVSLITLWLNGLL